MTQIVSFVSGIIVLVSLLAIGPFFSVLPKALLSAVIAVNLRGMFEQFHELKPLWNFSKVDFLVWIAGFLSVIIFGIDIGLGFAVLALIVSVRLSGILIGGTAFELSSGSIIKIFSR